MEDGWQLVRRRRGGRSYDRTQNFRTQPSQGQAWSSWDRGGRETGGGARAFPGPRIEGRDNPHPNPTVKVREMVDMSMDWSRRDLQVDTNGTRWHKKPCGQQAAETTRMESQQGSISNPVASFLLAELQRQQMPPTQSGIILGAG